MRCQGMKGAIALLLVTALFLGIGASMGSKAVVEPEIKVVDEGVLIENSGIPDLSKIFKQNNLEKNFADVIVNIRDIFEKKYKPIWETMKDSDRKIIGDIHQEILFLGEETQLDESKLWISELDIKIGVLKDSKCNYVICARTDQTNKTSYYVFIKQQGDNVFIKSGSDIARQSKDIIRRILLTDDANISYYDLDLLLTEKYATEQFYGKTK